MISRDTQTYLRIVAMTIVATLALVAFVVRGLWMLAQ